MTRGKAIQWLYWHHAREGWDLFWASPYRTWGRFTPFPLEKPR